MRHNKRILAAIGSAALLISNLGGVTQTVFAVEQTATEAAQIDPGGGAETTGGEDTSSQQQDQTDLQTSLLSESDSDSDHAVASDATDDATATGDGTAADSGGGSADSSKTDQSMAADERSTGTPTEDTGTSASTEITSNDTTSQSENSGSNTTTNSENTQTENTEYKNQTGTDAGTAGENTGDSAGQIKEGAAGQAGTEEQGSGEQLEDEEDTESSDILSYEERLDDITVRAEADPEIIPEGSVLKVAWLEKDELSEVEDQLDESDIEYDGYIAMDIHFEDSSGETIEPKDGLVKVTFDIDAKAIDDGYDPKSLEVQHFDESGDELKIVTVADTTDNEDTGTVTVSGTINTVSDETDADVVDDTTEIEDSISDENAESAVTAEFQVRSFSTFTVTWTRQGSSTSIDVTCQLENGTSLPDGVAPNNVSLSNSNSLIFNKQTIDGYEYVSAIVEIGDTKITDATEVKAQYKNQVWGGSWKYTYNTSDSSNNSLSSKPNITLIYKAGKSTITFDLNGGSGSTPDAISGNTGTNITLSQLPDDVDRSGYVFMGWSETQISAGAITDKAASNKILQPGDTYTLKGSKTLYAVWGPSSKVRADFFINLNGNLPPNSNGDVYEVDNGYWTNVGTLNNETVWVYRTDSVIQQRWISDIDESKDIIDDGTRCYVKNDVTDNQDSDNGLPTDEELVKLINAKLGDGAVKYENGELIANRKIGECVADDELYIHWYAQKWDSTVAINNGDSWHIDGVLRAKAHIIYNANAGDDTVENLPDDYHVHKGTKVTIGESGKVGGDVKTPTRDGYRFTGWNTQADGKGTSYSNGVGLTISQKTTLYAQWEPTMGSLKVSKNISDDSTKEFIPQGTMYSISVNITNITLMPTGGTYTAKVMNANDVEQSTSTVLFATGTETFRLEDGWYVLIEGLPDGSTYTVNETAVAGYSVAYTYYDKNGAVIANASSGTIVAGETVATNVNNLIKVVKTGVQAGTAPWAAILATMLIMTVGMTAYIKTKQHIQ